MDVRIYIGVLIAALLIPSTVLASIEVDEEEVVFRLRLPGGQRVYLVGDFNGWNPTMDRMAEREDGYELRLFLLPGRYRYRFIVDGASQPDPDNPNRDENNNSYFIFREHDGRFEIVYEETIEERGVVETYDAEILGGGTIRADEDGAVAYARGATTLVIDDRILADCAVGFEGTVPEEGGAVGRSYLLGAAASYRLENGLITAFTRADLLDFGDPLHVFGRVGPFDYPLGLFCRGLRYEGGIARAVESRVFFAGRIDGYRSGLESADGPEGFFESRDLIDTDMIGVAVSRSVGPLALRFVQRCDDRPKDGTWRFEEDGAVYRGHERLRVSGGWLSLEGAGGFTLDAQYCVGRSFLSSRERMERGASTFEPFESDETWERGSRFFVGCTVSRGRIEARASVQGTTLEGERELREGRRDGACVAATADVRFNRGSFACRAGVAAESYTAGNTGDVFWLQRRNFWLDGDRVTVDRLPFLTSRSIYEVRLDAGWGIDEGPYDPYGSGIRLRLMHRTDGNARDRTVTEAVLREGLAIGSRIIHLLDMRYVSYNHGAWRGTRRFLNVFTAVRLKVSERTWVSIGAGMNPYAFDRWRYRFTGYGREEYLIERGVFESVGGDDQIAVLRVLERAETALAEEWSFVVEAGFQF